MYSTSYKGDLAGFEIDPRATVIDYEGLQLKRDFYSPVYDTQEQQLSRLPDFRNLLYWCPDVITNSNGKEQTNFYTSDQPGKYAAVIQGLSEDGRAGTAITYFEVKKTLAIMLLKRTAVNFIQCNRTLLLMAASES